MEEKRGERMDWVEKEQDRKRRNNIDEAMDRLKNKTHEQYQLETKRNKHSNHYQRRCTEKNKRQMQRKRRRRERERVSEKYKVTQRGS